MAGDGEPTLFIRLYLDEHIWRKLAAELHERGFDAVNVADMGREGFSDGGTVAFCRRRGASTTDVRQRGWSFCRFGY